MNLKLKPGEKFAIEIFRTDGGINGFAVLIGSSKQCIQGWIENADPSKSKRVFIEKKFSVMGVDDWKREHDMELSLQEAVYIYSVRHGVTPKQIADKVKLHVSVIDRVITGFDDLSDSARHKLCEFVDKIERI